jgi:hypothetical protein
MIASAGKHQLTTSMVQNDGSSRQIGQIDDFHRNKGFVSITDSSNNWCPTFQQNAPAK